MVMTTFNTPRNPSDHITTQPSTHNPYARMPSRRAIACVTCAKAKTKCSKALPSCSRCITKGIKCEPRSTRRTSDHNYRSNVKKPSRTHRRHCSSGVMSRLGCYVPSIRTPSSHEPGISCAASHPNTEATMTNIHPISGLSSYPMLTPLSSKDSQVFNGDFTYLESPDQDLDVFTHPADANSYINLDDMSPQTPNPVYHYQPISVVHDTSPYLYPQSWSDGVLVPTEFGFNFSGEDILTKAWALPDATTTTPVVHVPWTLHGISHPSQRIPDDSGPHVTGLASPSQCQFRNFSDPVHSEWTFYEPTVADIDVVTSAPFIHDFNLTTNRTSSWEVPFTY